MKVGWDGRENRSNDLLWHARQHLSMKLILSALQWIPLSGPDRDLHLCLAMRCLIIVHCQWVAGTASPLLTGAATEVHRAELDRKTHAGARDREHNGRGDLPHCLYSLVSPCVCICVVRVHILPWRTAPCGWDTTLWQPGLGGREWKISI